MLKYPQGILSWGLYDSPLDSKRGTDAAKEDLLALMVSTMRYHWLLKLLHGIFWVADMVTHTTEWCATVPPVAWLFEDYGNYQLLADAAATLGKVITHRWHSLAWGCCAAAPVAPCYRRHHVCVRCVPVVSVEGWGLLSVGQSGHSVLSSVSALPHVQQPLFPPCSLATTAASAASLHRDCRAFSLYHRHC